MYYGFIYEWTNTLNGKKYIGSHAGTVDDGYVGSGKVFRRALKKYGKEAFSRSILEYVTIDNRQYLLEREKFYLDKNNAYYSNDFYNVAKDVIGGDTKAGWSDERRQEFSEQIRKVWADRTNDEKRIISDKTQKKNKEWLASEDGINHKNRLKETIKDRMPKMIEGIKNRDPEDRKRSARLGKELMGKERREEAAKKGVQNRNPETEANAQKQRQETKNSWSKERREEFVKTMSKGRKGKCIGSSNGRARKVVAASKTFDTLKEAMLQCNICEATLSKRLKSDEYQDYYYL